MHTIVDLIIYLNKTPAEEQNLKTTFNVHTKYVAYVLEIL